MKKSYLISDFERTVASDFPERAQELNAALDARLQTLRRENAGTGKKKCSSILKVRYCRASRYMKRFRQ